MAEPLRIAEHGVIPFADIAEGATAHTQVQVTDELIASFARLTGDANPLHTSAEFGRATPFGQLNAQGQLLSSLIVGVIGSQLPGPGWFCLGVNAEFSQPCFAGDTLEAGVRAKQRMEALKVIVWEGWVKRLCDDQALVRATIKTKYMF